MPEPETAELAITELSYNALAGQNSPTTLRFTAFVRGRPIQVLVDGRSTHSFTQSKVAHPLDLPIKAYPRLTVRAGNGTTLRSEGLIRQLPVKFSTHSTTLDVLVLPLFGADLVLGVLWLSNLGPVVFDFRK
ncbi:hypothetical protein NE237_013917 [Protea cynaroides]|uniref:Uncharacterized protein n=1 Tax=Protea cynaroides TaxID=273540 RepID=A0A9Q0H0T2_9MAGN|nr:hypothetical protein NE237_013917 [Protea cynaroides]